MKVRCIKLVDSNKEEVSSSPWFTLNKIYVVVSFFVDSRHEINLRVIADQGPAGIIVSLSEFEIVDGNIPRNWVVSYNNETLDMQPARWNDPMFWTNYFDCVPEAEKTFEEELAIILEE